MHRSISNQVWCFFVDYSSYSSHDFLYFCCANVLLHGKTKHVSKHRSTCYRKSLTTSYAKFDNPDPTVVLHGNLFSIAKSTRSVHKKLDFWNTLHKLDVAINTSKYICIIISIYIYIFIFIFIYATISIYIHIYNCIYVTIWIKDNIYI